DIAENVAGRGIRQQRLIAIEIALEVENSPEKQEKKKVSEVRKLHEFRQCRTRKLLGPKRRIYTCKPPIDRQQLRILPPRIHEVHEPAHFFKAKKKKQVRIPVPPEMPESR